MAFLNEYDEYYNRMHSTGSLVDLLYCSDTRNFVFFGFFFCSN